MHKRSTSQTLQIIMCINIFFNANMHVLLYAFRTFFFNLVYCSSKF